MGTQCSSAPLAERNFDKLHIKSVSIVKVQIREYQLHLHSKVKNISPQKVTKNG